jgi:serine O-acetyltransferase
VILCDSIFGGPAVLVSRVDSENVVSIMSTTFDLSDSPDVSAAATVHDRCGEEYDVSGTTNRNPPGLSLFKLWKEDLATHEQNIFDQGFWAVAVHRFGNWRMGIRPKLLRAPCTLVYRVLFKLVECLAGITLPYTCRVGRRVRIWHHSGIVLSAYSIGDDVHIRQNTTMGVVRRGENTEIPFIEEGVDIGCGACILGGVRVGRQSVIGANAVVLEDVPPYSVSAGVPARVVKKLDPTQ